jgi:AraC-like DNA-binding protein
LSYAPQPVQLPSMRSIASPPRSLTLPARLRDRVLSIDIVDDNATGQRAPVLPSPSVVLGVQWRGRMRGPEGLLAHAGVTGIQERARTYEALGPTTSILVRFTPTGAACLGLPLIELAGRSVALDDILGGRCARDLVERAAEAPSAMTARDVVINLIAELEDHPDRLVLRAVQMLAANGDDEARVAEVARSLAISERQLERRFLAAVGVTPKRWQQLNRFHAAMTAMRAGNVETFIDIAITAGYYDQAHFNRDVRRRTGMAPTALVRTR